MGTATTFDALIANPASEKVFLAEIKVKEELTNFTATAGLSYTYDVHYMNQTVWFAGSNYADNKYEFIRKAVVAVELDGVPLTAKASQVEVDATAGSYYHYQTSPFPFYIHAPADDDPNDHTVVVYFWLYFATKGINLNSRYYDPYIAENGIPSLSQEAQEVHWGASKLSAGSLALLNSNGYFDQIADKFLWHGAEVKILLGGDSLAYAEYTTIFTGRVMETFFTRNEFILGLESKAFELLRQLPINNFWTSTWANLDPSAEGKPIPYYWGSYSAAQAPVVTCINTAYGASQYQFKVCDCAFHAIKSITQVYVDYGAGAGWQTISHANEDLTNGTFTITAASFVVGVSRVKVSFEGYHSGGTLIEGAPDIVEDLLLNQCGYVSGDLDSTSFTASKSESACALNVFIENETSALTVIETICKSDLAFFDESGSGLLRYRTWSPAATGTIDVLTSTDFLADLTPEVSRDGASVYWKVKVGYSWLGSIGEYLYTEDSESPTRYKYGRQDSMVHETYLRSKADADTLATRLLWIVREPSPIISYALKAAQITAALGDKIKITLLRAPFQTAGGYDDRVFELVGKEISCHPLMVRYMARDLMTYGADVGLWAAAAAADWATATQQEKEDSGFWADANGYCLTADRTSLNKSRWW